MKKAITKFISLTLAMTLLSSLLCVNVSAETSVNVSPTGVTRIEGEAATEVIGGGYKRNMKTDDGAYALTYSPVAVADGQEYYATYVVNVEVAGEYNINAVASIRSQTYTSDWTIYANTEDNAVGAYVQGADVTTGWYPNIFKKFSCGKIYLEEGTNTIYWKVNEKDAPSGLLQAALDYIDLTPSDSIVVPEPTPTPPADPTPTPTPTPDAENSINISSTGVTRIEGEAATEIVGGGYKRNMKTDDGAYALTYSPVAVADGQEYYATYVVNVEVAGDYSLNAVASIRSQTYTSDWTIYVNTEDNAASAYVQGADVTTGWYSDIFKKFACGTIYLEEGINTIYWKVNGKDAPNGQLQAALDYIELTAPESAPTPTPPVEPTPTPTPTPTPPADPTPTPTPTPPVTPEDVIYVSATERTKIEGENYTDATVEPNIRKMNTPDDGRKAVNYVSFNPLNHDGKEFIVSYTFYVEKEGDFKLNVVSTLRSQTYTSDWTIYINETSNAVSKYIQGADVDTTFLQTLFKEYDCGIFHLKEGINTLYWKVNDADAPNGVLQAAMDYFELLPTVSIANIDIEMKNTLKRDEGTEISVLNGDGTKLGLSLFKDISFSADDSRIAMWKDNKVVAMNYGKTTVKFTLTDMNGNLYTVTKNISVVSEKGIWIRDAKVNGSGDVDVEISAIDDYNGGDKLLAIVYDVVDGLPTSVVSVSELTGIPNITKGNTQTITVNPGSISGTQKIAIFMLSGSDNDKAIYLKYIAE